MPSKLYNLLRPYNYLYKLLQLYSGYQFVGLSGIISMNSYDPLNKYLHSF